MSEKITNDVKRLIDVFGEPWGPPVTRYAEDPNTLDGDMYTEIKFGDFHGFVTVVLWGNGDRHVEASIRHDASVRVSIEADRPVWGSDQDG
jgi:hypothetical protein